MSDIEFDYIPASQGNRQTHIWTAKSGAGAVHIWASPQPDTPFRTGEFYGGVECHFSAPPSKFSPKDPPIDDCWLTGGPCWPDGSSLYFSENIAPYLEQCDRPFDDGVHAYMRSTLREWHDMQFKGGAT